MSARERSPVEFWSECGRSAHLGRRFPRLGLGHSHRRGADDRRAHARGRGSLSL